MNNDAITKTMNHLNILIHGRGQIQNGVKVFNDVDALILYPNINVLCFITLIKYTKKNTFYRFCKHCQ